MSGLQNGRSGRLHRSTSHGGSILGPTALDTMARTRDESTQFLKGVTLVCCPAANRRTSRVNRTTGSPVTDELHGT